MPKGPCNGNAPGGTRFTGGGVLRFFPWNLGGSYDFFPGNQGGPRIYSLKIRALMKIRGGDQGGPKIFPPTHSKMRHFGDT